MYDTGSSDVLKVDSIIKDGSRIGLTDDFPTSWDSHCGVIPGCTNFVNNLSTAIYNCEWKTSLLSLTTNPSVRFRGFSGR